MHCVHTSWNKITTSQSVGIKSLIYFGRLETKWCTKRNNTSHDILMFIIREDRGNLCCWFYNNHYFGSFKTKDSFTLNPMGWAAKHREIMIVKLFATILRRTTVCQERRLHPNLSQYTSHHSAYDNNSGTTTDIFVKAYARYYRHASELYKNTWLDAKFLTDCTELVKDTATSSMRCAQNILLIGYNYLQIYYHLNSIGLPFSLMRMLFCHVQRISR